MGRVGVGLRVKQSNMGRVAVGFRVKHLDSEDAVFCVVESPLGLEEGGVPTPLGDPHPGLLLPHLLDSVVGIQYLVHLGLSALLHRIKACVEACLYRACTRL